MGICEVDKEYFDAGLKPLNKNTKMKTNLPAVISKEPQISPFAKVIFVAGATRWTQREYEINFSPEDYLKAKRQMDEQDVNKDDYILLKIDYDVMNGKAKVRDKFCTCH